MFLVSKNKEEEKNKEKLRPYMQSIPFPQDFRLSENVTAIPQWVIITTIFIQFFFCFCAFHGWFFNIPTSKHAIRVDLHFYNTPSICADGAHYALYLKSSIL